MTTQPVLETTRLGLRPFRRADAPPIRQLAGAREIADMTLSIPHPYPARAAEAWIDTHPTDLETAGGVHCAVVLRREDLLIGAGALLGIDRDDAYGELGYWIVVPFWKQGFATEATWALPRFGFEQPELHRIFAHHVAGNPAFGRVVAKLGLRQVGPLRQYVRKGEGYENLVQYSVLRDEFTARKQLERSEP